jgi:hypothetical protein
MIFAFRFAPGHRVPGRWVPVGLFESEKELGDEPDGEYAVYSGTKAEIDEGPEAENPLPKSFTFERRVNVTTPAPKPSVRKA